MGVRQSLRGAVSPAWPWAVIQGGGCELLAVGGWEEEGTGCWTEPRCGRLGRQRMPDVLGPRFLPSVVHTERPCPCDASRHFPPMPQFRVGEGGDGAGIPRPRARPHRVRTGCQDFELARGGNRSADPGWPFAGGNGVWGGLRDSSLGASAIPVTSILRPRLHFPPVSKAAEAELATSPVPLRRAGQHTQGHGPGPPRAACGHAGRPGLRVRLLRQVLRGGQ